VKSNIKLENILEFNAKNKINHSKVMLQKNRLLFQEQLDRHIDNYNLKV